MTPHPGLAALLSELERRSTHSPRNGRVREAVRLRAGDACEYCLLPTVGQFQIEHIIPPALWPDYADDRLTGVPWQPGRGGPNHIANYAWACEFCNRSKRQRVARRSGRETHRLFDPRRDRWPEHFVFLHQYLFHPRHDGHRAGDRRHARLQRCAARRAAGDTPRGYPHGPLPAILATRRLPGLGEFLPPDDEGARHFFALGAARAAQ